MNAQTQAEVLTAAAGRAPNGNGKVVVNYKGMTGNLLSEFAVGWTIARMAGAKLCARPIEGFPGTRGFDRPRDGIQPLRTGGHFIDVDACLRHLSAGGDVLINGYHQRYDVFKRLKQPLKTLLRIVEGPKPEQLPGPDDFVAHVRLGSYFTPRDAPRFGYPLEEVVQVIKRQQFNKLHVVTNEVGHAFAQRLQAEFGAVVLERPPLADFAFLVSARRLLITPSSFSWWAAWLSDAEQILIPIEKGAWRRKNGIDLWVDDEPRYAAY